MSHTIGSRVRIPCDGPCGKFVVALQGKKGEVVSHFESRCYPGQTCIRVELDEDVEIGGGIILKSIGAPSDYFLHA